MTRLNLWRHTAEIVLLGACWQIACVPGEVERETVGTESMAVALPGADALTGWEMVSEPENYGPENLWDYINGQAEFYLNYGFVRVDAAEYRKQSGSPSVIVEIYQMASPEDAFGIFAAERNPEDRQIEVGSGGYLGSNVLNFWQGKNYIKLTSFEAGAGNEDALIALARETSAVMPAGSGELEAFSYFPEEGRIEAGERYIAQSFLGQGYLNRVYRVDYEGSGGGTFQLFLTRFDSNDEARAALVRYADFLKSQGRGVELVEGEPPTMVAETGMATIVFVQDDLLGGVLDAASLELGRGVAGGFAKRIADRR